MIVTCTRCGALVTLDDPPEDSPVRHKLEEIARNGLVCSACCDKEEVANAAAAQVARIDAQVTRYEALVPYEMRCTKVSRMCRPCHKRALAWQYGPRGLLLYGPTGTGKTRCAYLLLGREFYNGRTCMRFTHPTWNYELAEAQRNGTVKLVVEGIKNVDLLLIDDLGKGNIGLASGGMRDASEKLFDVFNDRFEHGRPTIITLQSDEESVIAMWPTRETGEAFVRRMRESCVVEDFSGG